MSARVWLGLDPSIASFGYAVMTHDPIAGGVPIVAALGAWKTGIDSDAGKLEDRARRVRELGASLLGLIDRWKPSEAYIESVVFLGKGRNSFMSVSASSRVRGLVEGICLCNGIELAEVRPDAMKQAVTGQRSASKDRVAEMVLALYKLPAIKNRDATDALAVAHVGAHRHGHGATVSSGVVSYRPEEDEDFLYD